MTILLSLVELKEVTIFLVGHRFWSEFLTLDRAGRPPVLDLYSNISLVEVTFASQEFFGPVFCVYLIRSFVFRRSV